MNKKYILCIFAVLITITNSSYAFPVYSKPMNKRAAFAIKSMKFNIPSEVGTSYNTTNTTEISVDDINNLHAVGKLDIVRDSAGTPDCCTASVITTNNGNIAITAAHCLYNFNTQTPISQAYFYPGYNNGQPGPVPIGKVTAISGYIFEPFTENPITYDYGLLKFDYPQGRRLQDDTGAFDYDLDIPRETYSVNVFGYPVDGGMDCTRDGQHLCEYDGLSFDMPPDVPNPNSYRAIKVDVGHCSSGGPWVRIYNPDTNTGNVMGVSYGILPEPYPDDESAAWSWTREEFTQLLNYAENH